MTSTKQSTVFGTGINVGANRTFDSSEVEWLKEFSEKNKKPKVPIIVVLTQSVPRKSFGNEKSCRTRKP